MSNANDSFIFIPDISGFSDFVKATEISHSQHIIAELLEAIIDANVLKMEVSEIEGDAVLFYRFQSVPSLQEIAEQVEKLFIDFHNQLQLYETNRICQCGACTSASGLSLKMIAHRGPLDKIKIHEHRKLHGSDLILAHRLLKNNIPVHEYLLLTSALVEADALPELPEGQPGWEKGQSEYNDFGEVEYTYRMLGFLKDRLASPPTIPVGKRVEKPIIKEILVRSNTDAVFELLTNLDLRGQWNKVPKGFEYDPDRVNRAGTQHVCVFDNRNIHLETVKGDFGKGRLVFGERSKDVPFSKEVTTYFILEEVEEGVLMRVEAHPVPAGGIKRLFFPIIRNGLSKGMSSIIREIKRIAEQQAA